MSRTHKLFARLFVTCRSVWRDVSRARRSYRRRSRIARRFPESLECRTLLTAVPWDNPDHLTLSIAPDGTDIAGQRSSFYASFAQLGAPADLRRILTEVFQSWSQHANLNVGVVGDGGQAFGIPGETEGDARFGDIRLGAISMSNDVLAVSIPHNGAAAGTWAGDIIFNSNFRPAGIVQFKAVATHEAGHVLGLEHSTDPTSPMYRRNSPATLQAPTTADIATLRQLHGSRVDLNELTRTNETVSNATRMRDASYDGTVPLLKYGDLSTATDVDFFQVDPIDFYQGSLTIQLRTAGQSFLRGHIAVVDAAGQVLASAQATVPGQDLTISFPAAPKRKVYVRVTAASGNSAFGIGRYALITKFNGLNTVANARTEQVLRGNFDFLDQHGLAPLFRNAPSVVFSNDLHLNDTAGMATSIKTAPGFQRAMAYETNGTISDTTDVDFYQIKSPSSRGSVLTVIVDAFESQRLQPVITVYDRGLKPLSGTVLRNANGTMSVQVPNMEPGESVFVRVSASPETTRYRTGNYSLKARFSETSEAQFSLLGGSLSSATPVTYVEMKLDRTTIFNFGVAAARSTVGSQPDVATQFTLFNSAGAELSRIVTVNESTRTSNSLLLLPGTYYVRVNSAARTGGPFGRVNFRILASVVSDPVGPIGTDPTNAPPNAGSFPENIYYFPPTYTPPPPISTQNINLNPYTYLPFPPVPGLIAFEQWYWYGNVPR